VWSGVSLPLVNFPFHESLYGGVEITSILS